ncbi:unnamed protein product [Parajaminaea phylloscopi]
MEDDLRTLMTRVQNASERVFGGEQGPIFIGKCSRDAFDRLEGYLSSGIKLKWQSIEGQAPHALGRLYFFGDPVAPHAAVIGTLGQKLQGDAKALDLWSRWRGGSTKNIMPRDKNIVKDPDGYWGGGRFSVDVRAVSTTLEVAVSERLSKLLIEIDNWARGGYNAIGVKIWETKPPGGQGPSVAPSVLVVSQKAMSSIRRVWARGQQAEAALDGSYAEVDYRHGDLVELPALWFGDSFNDRVASTQRVVVSLATLAVEAQNAADSADLPFDARNPMPDHNFQARAFERLLSALRSELEAIECSATMSEENKSALIHVRSAEVDCYAAGLQHIMSRSRN